MNDRFDVFLNLVFENVVEHIYIAIYQGYWSQVLFLCWIFLWFYYQRNSGVIELIGQCSFCFYFVEQFEEYWYQVFEVGIEFCTKHIWSWALFGWRFMMTASISLGVM